MQATGWPFRQPYQKGALATWELEPDELPKLYDGGDKLNQEIATDGTAKFPISFIRCRQRPDPGNATDQIRLFGFATLLLGNDGFPCFAQMGVSSKTLLENYVPIANELLYFRNLRTKLFTPGNGLNLSDKIVRTPSFTQKQGVFAYLFNYPQDDIPANDEQWLFLLNIGDGLPPRVGTDRVLGTDRVFDLSFLAPINTPGGRFTEYWCGVPLSSFPTNITKKFFLYRLSFHLFKFELPPG